MEEDANTPLISNRINDDIHQKSNSTNTEDDIQPINGIGDFFGEFYVESKKLWCISAPIIFAFICQYATGASTQIFAGQLGTFELAAVAIQVSVIAGFAIGIMMGMGSALETLCGQAYGAGQVEMLGIYMQRSWIILIITSLPLMLINIFATPILKLMGQSEEISKWAGKFALWMTPEFFAYAIYFPIQKFLQAQSKVMAMAVMSAVATIFHIFFSWLFMLRLGWGLVGAALVYNASWCVLVLSYLLYVFKASGQAWSGFSWKAFQSLGSFLKLSLASAVMICLEFWYFMSLVLFAGYLKNSEIAVDALSICVNILGLTIMVAFGFNAAVSVRVSNELGAGHPRAAKFSVLVATVTAFVISIFVAFALIIARKQYPPLFTNSEDVQHLVYDLTPLLAFSIVINNVQPVLSGVAIGAGWQVFVAYVNIVSYYVFGIPLGLILGFCLDMGVKGIWYGMLSGTIVQTIVLFTIIYKTNWNKEVSMAGERIREWGGEKDEGMIK